MAKIFFFVRLSSRQIFVSSLPHPPFVRRKKVSGCTFCVTKRVGENREFLYGGETRDLPLAFFPYCNIMCWKWRQEVLFRLVREMRGDKPEKSPRISLHPPHNQKNGGRRRRSGHSPPSPSVSQKKKIRLTARHVLLLLLCNNGDNYRGRHAERIETEN